jgi:hypothetical protein
VFRLDLPKLCSDRHRPKHTGYEHDLYAFSEPIVAGVPKHAVETLFLKHVDNLAAIVRKKLDEKGLRSLSQRDRSDWVRFLMSLRIRQPRIVLSLRNESADHLRKTLMDQPEQYEELAQLGEPPTLIDWAEQHFPGLIENFGLSFFHELVDNPDIGNRIFKMKWWIWDFSNQSHDLLLSDHPCIFTSQIDDPDLIVTLPITPKKAFMATQSERVASIMRRQDPKFLLMRMNESSLSQAVVRIYARNAASERFIRNRLSRRYACKTNQSAKI